MLAVGNVIIGRREEKGGGKEETGVEAEGLMHGQEGDLVELDEDVDQRRGGNAEAIEEQRRLRAGQDADAPL
jgi:hypothetical protein